MNTLEVANDFLNQGMRFVTVAADGHLYTGRGFRHDRSGSERMLSQAEWAELERLEDMLRQMTLAALKLPAGADRRDSLMMIGRFRDRIAAMKQTELNRASIMQMQQFKRTG